MKRFHHRIAALVVFASLLLPAAAQAGAHLELRAGWLQPDVLTVSEAPGVTLDRVDLDGPSYGISGGYTFSRVSLSASVSRYSESKLLLRLNDRPIRRETWTSEITAEYHVTPARRAVLLLGGGTGIVSARATDADEFKFRTKSNTTVTLHANVGVRIGIGDRFFLRPDARVRWYSGTDNDKDVELSLGFGFSLGGAGGP